MRSEALSFHHPVAFWAGCLLMIAGVLAHAPMLAMGAHTHYHLAGMAMDAKMYVGMALIPIGLALSAYGLMPRLEQLRRAATPPSRALFFHIADRVPLRREHWTMVLVMTVALAVDVMKPATLGFVMPGMVSEYGISRQTGALLALSALTGTTVGSVLWGRLGDVIGRRAAILFSALMFIGTSICGAMPSFEWNLAMCFLMGASAGGLLPIVFTLMAETIPAAHRGWLLVALGGIGTSAGYLLAAGAATLLEPVFSWRSLWLLGLPTGAVIIVLNRWIPESPRFLASVGLDGAARDVLKKFAGNDPAAIRFDSPDGADPARHDSRATIGLRALLEGRHAPITWGLFMCGVAWGLANFGFLLWLPVNLGHLGVDPAGANGLLARSAILALPGIGIVIWLYHRWSSLKSLVLFIGLTAAALIVFGVMGAMQLKSPVAAMAATAALLISVSGVISMLMPYAAEIYPVHLRGTGSGIIAASSKLGGLFGAGLGVIGFFEHFVLSALAIAVPMIVAAWLLLRFGIETRGRRLEEIENDLGVPQSG